MTLEEIAEKLRSLFSDFEVRKSAVIDLKLFAGRSVVREPFNCASDQMVRVPVRFQLMLFLLRCHLLHSK
jgi:hypothetical protein